MIDLVVVAVGIISITGAVVGFYISKDLSNYSNLTKVNGALTTNLFLFFILFVSHT
jgi:hypothetical protein